MHMREIVFDIDAGAAGLFDPPDEVDDLAHFGDAERRRRLVEHDKVGVVVHRPADRDALALAARQIGDRRIDGDADAPEADRFEQDLLRHLLLALDVDEAEAVGDLPADEEIAPQRLLLGQRLVLVDRLDRQIVRHADRIFAGLHFSITDHDPARARLQHAGHHLDQRRLAGAVVADEADDLVAADGEVDVAQRMHRAEIFLHALEANNGREITGRRHCVPIPAFPSRKRFGSAQADSRTVFCLTMLGTSISNIILSFASPQPGSGACPDNSKGRALEF